MTNELEARVSGEPGLAGVVPFRFACHRCARCCTGGSGRETGYPAAYGSLSDMLRPRGHEGTLW